MLEEIRNKKATKLLKNPIINVCIDANVLQELIKEIYLLSVKPLRL